MHQPIQTALNAVGNKGLYQKLFLAIMFFISAFVNLLMMGPTFIFMNPLFQCDFTTDIVNQADACDAIDQLNDFTITASAGLYCDGQTSRNLVQSISSIGSIVGLFVVNWISDLKGRKKASIFSQSIAMLSVAITFIGGYTNSVIILAISQFLGGFSSFSMLVLAYVYASEVMQQEFKERSLIIINYAWSLTCVLLGVLYYTCNRWEYFLLIFALAPMLGIFLISLFFLVEGPHFLYGQHKLQQSLQSIKTIAIVNDSMKQYQQILTHLKNPQYLPEQKTNVWQSLKKIMKDKTFRMNCIILILAEGGANMYYTGTNYALNEIGLDYGANMITTGLIQLVAYILLSIYITKIPRKKGLIWFYSIMVALGLLFLIRDLRESSWGSFVILGVIRFFGTLAYALIVVYLTQIFPLDVQSICTGIIQSSAQLGGFISPIIITLCINLRISPVVVLSIVIFAMVVLPMLKITQNKQTQSLLSDKTQTVFPLSEDQQKQKN